MSLDLPAMQTPRHAERELVTGGNPYQPVAARVMRVQELITDVRLFDLRFSDPELARRFTWRPGQFVELSVLGVGEGPFSLPSAPTRSGILQLAIRRAGVLTNYLFDHVREGDEVGLRGPLGHGFPIERFVDQDVLLVAGTINYKMAPVLKRIYDQMLEPKWVISMGACACSGGFYNNYTVLQGIDKIVPVDVYIPGCPPNPEGIIDAVVRIQKIIETGAPRAAQRWPLK